MYEYSDYRANLKGGGSIDCDKVLSSMYDVEEKEDESNFTFAIKNNLFRNIISIMVKKIFDYTGESIFDFFYKLRNNAPILEDIYTQRYNGSFDYY